MLLTEIFYHSDNFCKELDQHLKNNALNNTKPGPKQLLTKSEIMTIVIYFHHSKIRTFKDYYQLFIKQTLKTAFGKTPSYNRFIELISACSMPLYMFLSLCRLGAITGTSFIDSTKLAVCLNLRISSNRVFKGVAARGKTSTGWFYGFKLHIIINEYGEIIAFDVTPGNCDDRNEKVMNNLTKNLFGRLFGDRGYISGKLFKRLYEKGIQLFTKSKKNMPNRLIGFEEKLLLNKRGLIESVNAILKTQHYIEHTRHRSKTNFFVNLIAGLIAYSFRDKKPTIIDYPVAAIAS